MGYVKGDPAGQSSLFPPSLDELVPDDHLVRVIAAFVDGIDLGTMGFERAAEPVMGRPAYDPADMLKLYLYGYLNRVRSSRRLERECQRNVELMWLLGRLAPDFKTIAEFRRRNAAAFGNVCRGFVRFCAREQLLGGHLVAIDGSKFKAVSGKRRLVTAKGLEEESRRLDARITNYLKSLDEGDREEREPVVDGAAVAAALKKLREAKADCDTAREILHELGATQHVIDEPEAKLMRTPSGREVAYNVQTAVDSKHGLIVHHEVTNETNDTRQLEPMAKAAKEALDERPINVVADAGYFNQSQFAACEAAGITPFVPANLGSSADGASRFYSGAAFLYDIQSDSYRCPAGKILGFVSSNRVQQAKVYAARKVDCDSCPLKSACTNAPRRYVQRHLHEEAGERAAERLATAPEMMTKRRSLAEHPFADLKYWVFGDPRFLMKGLRGARGEMALAVLARNLRRAANILGNRGLAARFAATG